MNKQIAAAMAVVMAVFLTAACIGASAGDADAAGPFEFTVDFDGYSISFYATEQASEGENGTAYITNVTINEGSTDVELELPETVTRSDVGYEGTYNVTGVGTKGNAMVVFSTEDGADNIKSISMPDTYTWLTSQAFVYCSNLESVKLSAGLESIEEQTFSSITHSYISDGNIVTEVIAPGTQITSIDIPEGIKTIGVGAFKDCPTLTHVSIPSTVTEIKQDAFRNTGLTSVEIESADSSTERSIGDSAFASNGSLATISIPEGFMKISDKAFQNCRSITQAIIPSTVDEMWNNVFDGCSSLATVTFEGDTEFKGSSIFRNCSALENVELHEGMHGEMTSQFSGCKSLKEIEVPEGFVNIESNTFSGCTALIEVVLGADCSISESAFEDCSSLVSVTIGDGVFPVTSDGSVKTHAFQVDGSSYSTLQEAIDSISTSGEIQMQTDYTYKGDQLSIATIPKGKNVTVDLCGYDLITESTYSGKIRVFTVEGELVVTDSTVEAEPVVNDDYSIEYESGVISGSGTTIYVHQGGSAVIESGTVRSTGDDTIALYSLGDLNGQDEVQSAVIVEGGFIDAVGYAVASLGLGASASIEGGVLTTTNNPTVSGNGSMSEGRMCGGVDISISGGTIIAKMTGNQASSGYVACGVYMPNYGTLNISSGDIVSIGGVGVLSRAGDVTISGGTITSTGTASGQVCDEPDVEVPSAAVVLDVQADYPGKPDAAFKTTITGGTFSSDVEGTIQQIYTEGDEMRISISGGIFDNISETLIADGYWYFPNESEESLEVLPSVTITLSQCHPEDTDVTFVQDGIEYELVLNQPLKIKKGVEYTITMSAEGYVTSTDSSVPTGDFTYEIKLNRVAPTGLSIDNRTEGIVVPVGMEYAFDNHGYTPGTGNLVSVEPGDSIYIRYVKTDTENESASVMLTAPLRAVMETISIDYQSETVNATGEMSYYVLPEDQSSGSVIISCDPNMNVSEFLWDGTREKTVVFFIASDETSYASEEQSVTIPVRPVAPVVDSGDYSVTTGTIAASSGLEISRDEGVTWSSSLTGLSSGTTYSVLFRTAATETSFASLPTDAVSIRTTSSSGGGGSVTPTPDPEPDEDTETVTNPDGSTTTTTTRPDGSSTVTTERPDGSSTTTEERPVTGGTQTTVTETDTEGNTTSTTTTETETVTSTGSTVSSTTVEKTDSDGNMTSTTESTYTSEDESTVTSVTVTTDAEGNTTAQASTTVSVAASDDGTVKVTGDVIAEAVNQINDATYDADEAAKVIAVQPSGDTQRSVSIVIEPEAIKQIADTGAGLEISGDVGIVTTSAEVSQTLAQQTAPVTVSIQVADKTQMAPVQQDAVGEAPTYQLLATTDDGEIHELGGTVTVSVPYALSEGEVEDSITVHYVDNDGVMHAQPTTYADGVVTFTTTHFSYYTIVSEIAPAEDGGNALLYIGVVVVIAAIVIAAVVYSRSKARTQ